MASKIVHTVFVGLIVIVCLFFGTPLYQILDRGTSPSIQGGGSLND